MDADLTATRPGVANQSGGASHAPTDRANAEAWQRKTLAVRVGYLATALLVAVAIGETLATRPEKLAGWRWGGLLAVGLAYVLWTLHSSREAVRFTLWNRDTGATPPAWPDRTQLRHALRIVIQFVLAETIVWLAGSGGALGLLWIILLPPVAHGVMFLTRPGIVIVTLVAIGIHTCNVSWWYGWAPVPMALTGFSVAVLFTLVFTQIAVSAERSRAEVERLAREIHDANQKLREYALGAEELAATRERNRVAREIHDTLGHFLTVVHVQLEAARTTLEQDPVRAMEALSRAQAVTHDGLQEIRQSVAALRASPLQDRSLVQAIEQLVQTSDSAGLSVHLKVLGEPQRMSPPIELTIYRAAQEGLTNCRKHAAVNSADVVLDFQNSASVKLAVSDQGAGSANVQTGFGLLGLRERATLLGGSIQIRTTAGEGFILELEIPR